MRDLPADLIIDPTPHTFDPPITDDGAVLRWSGLIAGERYAIGLRPARTAAALDKARDDLRYGAWQLHELARLGRKDLMVYAHQDRHLNRVKPKA